MEYNIKMGIHTFLENLHIELAKFKVGHAGEEDKTQGANTSTLGSDMAIP